MQSNRPYKKPFSGWHGKKENIHKREPVKFNEREIWWVAVGVNVGYEIDGKGEDFLRPTLILKKTSKENFIGIPITSNKKELPGYFIYQSKVIDGSIIFEQARVMSSRRLIDRMEIVSKNRFRNVMDAFLNYLNPR